MITVIAGTNRAGSNSMRVARELQQIYAGLGAEVQLLDLAQLPAEVFLPTSYSTQPAGFERDFVATVLASHGLHLVVPEYNGSFPGVLKLFIDLLPFPQSFEERAVAFTGIAAGSYGGLRAVEQLQMVFAYRNARLHNKRVFITGVGAVLNGDGRITDAGLAQRIREQAAGFLSFASA